VTLAPSVTETALLPVCPLEGSGSRLLSSDWTSSPTSTCFFVFTTSRSLVGQELITSVMLKHEGFLPSGLFERLLARGCTWSQKTSSAAVIQQLRDSLFKDVAVLPYGAQRVRLRLRDDINCIEMNVEGHNPLGAYQRVKEQISVIINECMQSLLMFAALEIPTSSSYYVVFETYRSIIPNLMFSMFILRSEFSISRFALAFTDDPPSCTCTE
jgi:hypothetical protein